MTSSICGFGLGDGAPGRAFGARVAHRLELALRHVGTHPTMAQLHPFLDLFAERIDHLVAALWGGNARLTGVASAYVASDGVMVTPDQRRRISKAVGQIVGSQDLHDLLGLLHGSSSVHTSEAEAN